MDRTGRARLAACVTVLLVSVPAFAQPPRPQTPPDIAGEWSLRNDEDPGQIGALGQPPLGEAGRH